MGKHMMEEENVEIQETDEIKSAKIRRIKRKKMLRNLIIIVVIVALLLIGLKMYNDNLANNNSKTLVEPNSENSDTLEIAVARFKQLGETINKEDLEIVEIQRDGELYYYISAKENTLEIRKSDNKIVRENSIIIEI